MKCDGFSIVTGAILAGTTVSIVLGSSGISRASDNSPALRPIVWEAPVGTRQPTEADLPPSVRRSEGKRTQGQKAFDKKLKICRGC